MLTLSALSDSMDGFLVIDKPAGMTSHDVVSRVRRELGQKKAGHTGTLDPFATGVLPVALGEGTKAIHFLDESVKEYSAVMRLGVSTDTQDFTGLVTAEREWDKISPAELERVFSAFTGKIEQLPPMFSALKRNGVPLYKLARMGQEVEREPRAVEISSLVIDRIDLPLAAFTVRCSRGTYVRTLASDIGERLMCGAHLVELRRIASGLFTLDMALSLQELARCAKEGGLAGHLISPYAALGHLPDIHLLEPGERKVSCGVIPDLADMPGVMSMGLTPGAKVRLSREGRFLAVAEVISEKWAPETKNMRLLRGFN